MHAQWRFFLVLQRLFLSGEGRSCLFFCKYLHYTLKVWGSSTPLHHFTQEGERGERSWRQAISPNNGQGNWMMVNQLTVSCSQAVSWNYCSGSQKLVQVLDAGLYPRCYTAMQSGRHGVLNQHPPLWAVLLHTPACETVRIPLSKTLQHQIYIRVSCLDFICSQQRGTDTSGAPLLSSEGRHLNRSDECCPGCTLFSPLPKM